jgi:hypothetical protein
VKTLIPFLLMLAAPLTLDQRLARWRPVDMPFDSAGLSAREKQMVGKLAEASRNLDQIYWRQSDPEGLALYEHSADNPKLHRLLKINAGRFDLLDDNRPFVGTEPMPPGRGFYPKDLTRAEIERYVREHPEKKAELYSPYTVVRRQGAELVGIPYHVEYRQWLEGASRDLKEAAALSSDPQFAEFLRQRATALLDDNYYASDLLWLDLKDPKFDVIFAPYETYLDDLLGVKTSYGAAVLIRNDAESKKLEAWRRYIPDLQDALPLPPEDLPSKRGHLSPMEVMDAPFRAGDLAHGYQAVADNLPNDPKIHELKGSKKIFFKNYMDARVKYIILPIAKRLMRPEDAALASGEGYLATTVLHEISHGLGPAYARQGGKRVDIREAIGPVYSGLEEAKADTVGMFCLKWLADHKAVSPAELRGDYASYLAGMLRTLRFGAGEAHGQAETMEFNYLRSQKAIVFANGRYGVDYDRMPAAVAALAKELLEIEATGDRARAEHWFARYETISPELKNALHSISDIPVDIDPIEGQSP